jgi:hypothetical protein
VVDNPTTERIERAAAYYYRASAQRAVHGSIPPNDHTADVALWANAPESIKREMRTMIVHLMEAANDTR